MAEVSAPGTDQEAQTPITAEPRGATAGDALVAEELLVEEISIDGMCGVY
ncbi:MAG TPA: mycofactocin precursor MftA [Streptosporangiaceae bacterium]|nr:mycofactocin precursor MftA [Streptosporangiaceae bacterium]